MQCCVGVADIVGCPATDFVDKSINGWLAGKVSHRFHVGSMSGQPRRPRCLRHAVVGARQLCYRGPAHCCGVVESALSSTSQPPATAN